MKKYLFLLILVCLSLHASENKICILGSCSGTEPLPGRHHTAWILQTGGRSYQFDAGENCAYTAVTNNIDLMNLHAVFISHPHFDHVGGLPHLLWTRNKFAARYKRKYAVTPLPVYTPLPQQIEALFGFMTPQSPEKNVYRQNLSIQQVKSGVMFDDGNIKVEALKNRHCKPAADGTWLSYSYRISAAGKKIVFSGDMQSINELAPFLGDCDILLVESGHHRPWEIAATIRKNPAWSVRKLVFLHHGRDYLEHPEKTLADTAKAWGSEPVFATDGFIVNL